MQPHSFMDCLSVFLVFGHAGACLYIGPHFHTLNVAQISCICLTLQYIIKLVVMFTIFDLNGHLPR
jgi:hypothetical protein